MLVFHFCRKPNFNAFDQFFNQIWLSNGSKEIYDRLQQGWSIA